MRGLLKPVFVLAAAVLVLVVAGCGGDGDDEGNARRIQANETDLAFATEMLAHHERGIDAADLARRRAEDPVVRRSARDLIQLTSVEAQTLRLVRKVLAEGGVEQGSLGVPGTALDPAQLRPSGDFDRAYTDAMIAHQQLAIRMAAVERRKGVHQELRRMSGDITDLARFQIRQLQRRLPSL
jgi:uncharacterized protein (DUF305 family)